MSVGATPRSRLQRARASLQRAAQAVLAPLILATALPPAGHAAPAPQAVIVDTDIGDDIDDAFALALVLRSPSLRLEAVSASFGDTDLRARLLDRMLAAAGRGDVPVLVGPRTPGAVAFTQSAYARAGGPPAVHADAVDGILQRLRTAEPGSITLLALAPLDTVAALIARDPVAFRRLRQVVMMGGWIRHGYPPQAGATVNSEPEYNVARDPDGLRALLASGVPVRIMPLDATFVSLRAMDRARIFGKDGLNGALRSLFAEWRRTSPYADHPVMFDVVPVAWMLDPSVCDPKPMHVTVSDDGSTRAGPGAPNASACLSVDADKVRTLLDGALAPH